MLQLVDRAVWMGIINLLLLCAVIIAQNWRQMATRQMNPLIVFVSVSLAVYTMTILMILGSNLVQATRFY
ncbi:MAG: hypothetical protein GX165_00760 [Firmicutes bacterium]|nr:hypothetical protein [Bacillota bacterium]